MAFFGLFTLLRRSGRWLALPLACAIVGCRSDSSTDSTASHLETAWQSYRLGEFDRAAALFQELERDTPVNSLAHAEALYGQASVWNTRRDRRNPALAISYYDQVLQTANCGALAAWAALDRVRVDHLAGAETPLDHSALAQRYRAVYLSHPQTPAGQEAQLLALALESTGAAPPVLRARLAEYRQFLETHPGTPFRARIHADMSRIHGDLGEFDLKLQSLILSVEERERPRLGPPEHLAVAYWFIATCAEFDAGDFATARTYYRRLMETYPQDLLVFRCRKALERMDEVEHRVKAGLALPAAWLQPTGRKEAP